MRAVNGLPPLERHIIETRYLAGEDVARREIAHERGCTRQYISQVEKSALIKLKRLYQQEVFQHENKRKAVG
ncbi:sigma factor-like helix-turn-helix DNA-binding protein [Thermodesulfobacteriota bacterium]